MPLDSPIGVQSARPKIFVGGAESATLSGGLMNLLIFENTAGLARCEAAFGNWGPKNGATDFLYFDRQLLDFGKDFEIRIGQTAIFIGKITALEADFPAGQPPAITVLAEDAVQNLRMTRRTRSFEKVTDSDVFRQIAGEHNLTANVDSTAQTHKVLTQLNQSDLAFLRERARSLNFEIWISDGKQLNLKARQNRAGENLKLNYGAQLWEFRVIADLANQRTSVIVGGWDVSGKSEAAHEAAESVISQELNGDISGISILGQKFGARKESIAHFAAHNAQESQTVAESCLKTVARRFVTGRGVAEPNAQLRVGAILELGGLGAMFNGKYYLSEIAHIFDSAKGFRTEFAVERLGIGGN